MARSRWASTSARATRSSGCWASAAWAPSTRRSITSWASSWRIKVIRPEVMADPVAAAELERRFKQELLLARQVTHKNVVRIHDLGEIDGIKFLTMPFIEGEELATLIQREPHTAARARVEDRPWHRHGPRGRACRRRRASRLEARQHHGGQGRRGPDHGLRHRQVHGRPESRSTCRGDLRNGKLVGSRDDGRHRWSARSSTWRPSRRGRSRSTSARISTRSD